MKDRMVSILLVVLVIFFIPIFVTTLMNGISVDKDKRSEYQDKVTALIGGEEEELSLDDYLIGVVAAEMPVNFNIEALKAQAVAARTYTLNKLEESSDFVFTYNDQAYLSQIELENQWGTNNFAKNYNKIRNAVIETKGQVIKYEGDLIEAVFHSTSAGKTQSAEQVWGENIPYLSSVDSLDDINSPEYTHKTIFTQEEFINKIKENEPDFQNYTENIISEIQIIDRSNAGYVNKIQVGNKILDGEQFRNYLNLESSNFYFFNVEGNIEILCKGYGHGVGLSQYGADFLAQKGYTYKEILEYYYTGIEIVN